MLEPFPTLDRGALSHGTTNTWGNSLGKKTPNTLRVCFQNLDGISQLPDGDRNLKLHLLLQFTTTYQVDVFAAAELNTCWDLVPPNQRLPRKTKGWWENSQWSISHNRTNNNHSSSYQPGSMGIVMVNALSHRALKPGTTPAGWDAGAGCIYAANTPIMSGLCPCIDPAKRMDCCPCINNIYVP